MASARQRVAGKDRTRRSPADAHNDRPPTRPVSPDLHSKPASQHADAVFKVTLTAALTEHHREGKFVERQRRCLDACRDRALDPPHQFSARPAHVRVQFVEHDRDLLPDVRVMPFRDRLLCPRSPASSSRSSCTLRGGSRGTRGCAHPCGVSTTWHLFPRGAGRRSALNDVNRRRDRTISGRGRSRMRLSCHCFLPRDPGTDCAGLAWNERLTTEAESLGRLVSIRSASCNPL